MSEAFENFKLIGQDLYMLGLVESHGGDMSVREGDRIFITRKNCMLGHLKEGDIIEVGMEPGQDDPKASPELMVHRAIYKDTSFKAVIHAHPVSGIAMSMAGIKLTPKDSEGLSVLRSIPVVKVRDKIGSDEVARLLPPIYKSDYLASLVMEHGSYTVGGSLEEALKYTTCLEQSCRILVTLKSIESRPTVVQRQPEHPQRRQAIPPSIGVMDRSRTSYKRGGFNR